MPRTGWLAWVADEPELVVWDGADWVPVAADTSVNPKPLIVVNPTHNDKNAFDVTGNRLIAPADGTYLIGTKWRFKANASVPASIQTQLHKNGVPLPQTAVESSGPVLTLRTHIATQTSLKLEAGDAINVFGFLETNNGFVNDEGSLFFCTGRVIVALS